jgi:hypothetical protein
VHIINKNNEFRSFSDQEIACPPFLVFTIVRFLSKVYVHYRHKGVHYA